MTQKVLILKIMYLIIFQSLKSRLSLRPEWSQGKSEDMGMEGSGQNRKNKANRVLWSNYPVNVPVDIFEDCYG